MHDTDDIASNLTWPHWGGGPADDILVEVGLLPAEYFRRLRSTLDDGTSATLAPEIARAPDVFFHNRLTAHDQRNTDWCTAENRRGVVDRAAAVRISPTSPREHLQR